MLIEPQFSTQETDALWSAESRIRRMQEFEAALAEVQGQAGVIPNATGKTLGKLIRAAKLDAEKILEGAKTAGTPIIPFVKALTAAVAAKDEAAAKFVHYGSTTQDVVDSAAMMAINETIALVDEELRPAIAALVKLAEKHAATPIAARTVLQQATPITFGLKAGLWALGLERARNDLLVLRNKDTAVQLGGAVGTLGTMGDNGAEVRAALAKKLNLADPGICWHQLRDPILHCGTALAQVCGASAKVARDVQLLMQNEVAEAAEQSGEERGGSSAMPHKHNPVDSMVAVAVAQNAGALLANLSHAMVFEHERSPGGWHGEWIALPLLTSHAHAAARAIRTTAEGLTVDPTAMAHNLEILHGLPAAEALASALGATLGKIEAQALIRKLSARVVKEKKHLKDLAAKEPAIAKALGPKKLDDIFAHKSALKASESETKRVVAHVKKLSQKTSRA